MSEKTTNVTRITVGLSTEQVRYVQYLAEKEKSNPAEIISRAISLEKWWLEQKQAGKKIITYDGHDYREITRK